MRAAADDAFPNETGGLLMGHVQAGGAEITTVIGAGPDAVMTRCSFTPDRDWQYEQIDCLFYGTRGAVTYVGEWHSHPSRSISLSGLDRSLLREISETPAARCQTPLMGVLAGGGEEGWAEAFFRYEPQAGLPWRRVRRLRHMVVAS
jgi:integrative and conjugative element protein (TIGR02256 family)